MYQTEVIQDLDEEEDEGRRRRFGEEEDDEEEEEEHDRRPNRCRRCLYYIWKVVTCIFSHIILVSLVVAYCILGAFTFESLEAEHEVQVKANISSIRNAVSDRLWDMTRDADVLRQENWTREVKEHLKNFETDLLTAMKKDGWDGTEDQVVTQWTFAGALFYSIIVITTIGYGHIAPKTHWGKVVTIFYAILGIPLMLLCLSNIGDIMAHSFRFMYWRVCCYMCTRKPKRPPSRRGRSIRGTIRSTSGTRSLGRSRQQSFKHPGARISTRSADSALGLSESMIVRSSYSDTECRYNDDILVADGAPDPRRPDAAVAVSPAPARQLRSSQRSRYSDTAVPVRTGDIITPTGSVRSKPDTRRDEAPAEFQLPVLFNKYALDREESMRAQRPDRHSNRETSTLPRQQQYHTRYPSSPYGGSLRRQADPERRIPAPPIQTPPSPVLSPSRPGRRAHTSPRIMSPMGFAVPRQTSYRPAIGSRMDHSDLDDYEYETNSGSQSSKIKPVPIWLCVFLVVSYIFGGAFLFSEWEHWHFLDSAYFCFITLTTIGFGDFVPAQRVQKNAEISIALCSLYLLFGIALLAMSFNLVQEEVINNVKSMAKRLGIIKEDEDDDV